MGWFSDAVKGAVTGGLSSGSWEGAVSGAIAGIGQGKQEDAQEKAQEQAQDAYDEQRKLYQKLYNESLPARSVLQQVVASDPSMLRPAQERVLDDTLRGVRAGLAASGTRGNPRAVAAGFDALDRQREREVERNRQEQLQASRYLAGQGFAQVPGIARAGLDRDLTGAYGSMARGSVAADTYGLIAGLASGRNRTSILDRIFPRDTRVTTTPSAAPRNTAPTAARRLFPTTPAPTTTSSQPSSGGFNWWDTY